MMGLVIEAMERGLVPDAAVRAGIRRLCRERLDSFRRLSPAQRAAGAAAYLESLRAAPVAVHTQDANRQHYELPAPFFELVLGDNLKYSSGFWPEGCGDLTESEDVSLDQTVHRAELSDGQRILELGCGWGSLTLAMARRFPASSITAVSNSAPQRLFIEAKAKREGLANVAVLTRDISRTEDLGLPPFDRVVSVEMFEHMKNYRTLLSRIAGWLAPGGKLFVHIFTHRDFAYPFETEGEDNWMGRHFFTGGQMPSHGLLAQFQEHMTLEQDWVWSGRHYSRTSRAWLENMDRHRARILEIFRETYGPADAARWYRRWRIFFMACEELFGYKNGSEWGVSHYRFVKGA